MLFVKNPDHLVGVFFGTMFVVLRINDHKQTTMSKVKIYTLSDPRTGQIRYIGKTSSLLNQRLSGHIHDSKSKSNHRHFWIQSLLKKGLKPTIELLDECHESNWQEIETMYIAQFRGWGFRLVNTSDGGDGGFDKIAMEKARQSRMRKICQYNHNGELMKVWESLTMASINSNTSLHNISTCCNGKRQTANHFQWKYYSETKGEPIAPYVYVNNYQGKKHSATTRAKISATRKTKKVIQMDLNGMVLKIWNSISLASKNTTVARNGIRKSCMGLYTQAGGFQWQYA